MEKLKQVVQQLNARVDSIELAEDRRARQQSWVWRGLTLLHSDCAIIVSLVVSMLTGLCLGHSLRMNSWLADPFPLELMFALTYAAVQGMGQLMTVHTLKFLYLHYTWLCAVVAALVALFQKEFPAAPQPVKSEAEQPPVSSVSQAHQTRVDAQWARLESLLERYRTNARIALCNDLATGELIYEENRAHLLALGYHMAQWGMPDRDNALVPQKGTIEASCTLF